MTDPQLDRYANQLGSWLDGVAPWDYWATLTFREPYSLPAARRAADRYFKKVDPALAFWAVESGKRTGRNHIHALMQFGPDCPMARTLWERWFKSYGRAHVDKFDPELGAAHYVSKYVTKQLADYDLYRPAQPGLFH